MIKTKISWEGRKDKTIFFFKKGEEEESESEENPSSLKRLMPLTVISRVNYETEACTLKNHKREKVNMEDS